jgi:hypothetical protein
MEQMPEGATRPNYIDRDENNVSCDPFGEMVHAAAAEWNARFERASIVTLRRVGPGGGQGCRLRYTPPDVAPPIGNRIKINGDSYKVIAVEPVKGVFE